MEQTAGQHVSARARRTRAQPISWLMQQAVEVPGLVSLAAGLVDRVSLPARRVLDIAGEILGDAEAARDALQYGTTQGYRRLRELVAQRYVSGTAYADPEAIIVTGGSQQFLELLGEAWYDPGDIVIVEDPTYFVYTGVLESFGVRTRGVATDAEGMIVEDLRRVVAALRASGELERVKAIYTVSYSQNPGGRTLSLPRRQALMALAAELPPQILVVEDAAYYELSFDLARRPPLLATLDAGGERVVTALTASKPFAPGLKTGFGILPPSAREAVVDLKGNHDFGSNNFSQHIVARAMTGGAFDAQAAELRALYARKARVLEEALRQHLPSGAAEWDSPDGGLYLWLRLPGVDTSPESAFFRSCLQHRVLYVPGSYAYAAEDGRQKPCDRLRLTFGVASEEELREGARRLAAALRAL